MHIFVSSQPNCAYPPKGYLFRVSQIRPCLRVSTCFPMAIRLLVLFRIGVFLDRDFHSEWTRFCNV